MTLGKRLQSKYRMNTMPLFPSTLAARCLLFALLLSTPWFTPRAFAGEPPRVVASILPIHSLVSGVMHGVGRPSLIVKGYASPHTYRMRPSDMARLHDADLVFWIGDTLESFLRKPLSSLPETTRVISLLKAPGLALLGNRQGGPWQGPPSDPEPPHDHTHTHAHVPPMSESSRPLGYNPHIWLDPGNAARLVEAIASHLYRIDPDRRAHYQANSARLLRRIGALERTLEERLSLLRDTPYLVFHDAFPYLETRYGLHGAGAITTNPAVMPGARRIAELRAAIKRLRIRCIFREPQFDAGFIATLLEGTQVDIATLDPLGVDIPPGPDHWFRMMDSHARAMTACLSPDGVS
uniref:High-affinity zinc uptake system protein ZnuA n=1 Tax=Candidatus Kentrum sp. LFY TaxID=2126342 RepID=A0A450UJH7_9GAMM|nr:MAG: zinc transport system substrate-binding protein [Candidatus Kentron sp. LFY]